MQKMARLSAALVFASALALTEAAAAPRNIPSAGFTVLSGTLRATVDGQTVEYKKGDVIPEQAVVTAGSDAQVSAANGMTIRVNKGTTYQAAYTAEGLVDIKATSGGSATVSGFGNTYVLPVDSEANLSGDQCQVISGNVSYTDPDGGAHNLGVGQHMVKDYVSGSYTYLYGAANGVFKTILMAPPSSTQEAGKSSIVSPSAP